MDDLTIILKITASQKQRYISLAQDFHSKTISSMSLDEKLIILVIIFKNNEDCRNYRLSLANAKI